MTDENNESFMEISGNGNKYWKNSLGQLHRLDGPAIEYAHGSEVWYKNGKKHRINGPADISNSAKGWYFEGKLHRLDGPAVENINEWKEWWVDGKRHRLDGPAVERSDGSKFWYVNNIRLSKKNFDNWVENNGTDWNEEIEIMFKLSYS